jgi:hypothetical protein
MAHAINLNAYADYDEQPGIFARLRQSFTASWLTSAWNG